MTELKRALTSFDMTMIAIGAAIGSGIFLTPALVANALPSPLWILGVWLLGGIMALCGALTYAELGAMMPRAGGLYVFLSEAYGGLFGFLFGWAYFLVVNTGSLAALAIAFSTYFGFFIPLSEIGITIVAISGLTLVTILNVVGVKAGGIFSDVFTVLKLLGIAVLVFAGLGWGSWNTTDFAQPLRLPEGELSNALTLAMVSVLWSYGGWQHATFTASEAVNPQKTVPRALILGSAIIMLVYILANVAYMFLMPLADVADSPRVAADALTVVLGGFGGAFISLTIFISTFGTSGIYTLTAPRIYYAMARDGVFFKRVAEVHPRFRTPAYAILFQSAWAVVLILIWGTYEKLISYVVFTDWIFFGLAAASVFVFRRRMPNAERPYRTLGYPFTPLFFTGTSVWFVLNTFISKPQESWAGIGFLALGIPVYYFWKRRSMQQ
jgi:APA family basic amino acid/polyamine antiporter